MIEKFEREANVSSPKDRKRKQVDFRVYLQGQEHLCELKASCISQAAETPRNLQFYSPDDHVGLIKDFKKLDESRNPNKWVVASVYPAPDSKEGNNAIASLPGTLRHWKPVTILSDFPDWMYIALWKECCLCEARFNQIRQATDELHLSRPRTLKIVRNRYSALATVCGSDLNSRFREAGQDLGFGRQTSWPTGGAMKS